MNNIARKTKSFLNIISGKGRSLPEDRWDAEYGNGGWDHLRGLEEVCRYSVITGYIRFFKPGASVLDLGCGEGLLLKRFCPESYSHYTGVDLSEGALNLAKGKYEKAVFIKEDVDKYQTSESFDVIVFNELLYYVEEPLKTLRRYDKNLAEKGVHVVSIHNKWRSRFIIRKIKLEYRLIDEVTIRKESGLSWTCMVLEPAGRA